MHVIYVCRVYAQKYGIGLKLKACVATLLTVETGKRTTGLLVSAPIPIPTCTGEYQPIPDTQYWYRSNPKTNCRRCTTDAAVTGTVY